MRIMVAAVTAASVLASSAFAPAFAVDPFNGQGWQKSRPPVAVAYFKFQFHQDKQSDALSYGLAVTAPTPRAYGSAPIMTNDTPKLLDLRFKGVQPHSLMLSGQTAWSMTPGQESEETRHHLFVGGLLGWAVNLALTGAAVYGVYSLLKKECPAISTTTGGCVETAN